MPFDVGESVGPYNLVARLGQGGMATVYKAYHPALDRDVAIKVLHFAFMDDKKFLARFQREARVVARLEHPNIVPVYDFSEFEGRPYLVMKFIEGETLKDRLEKGRLPSSEILRVVDSVGSALAYAHRQNILHRDIKPSNVLLGQDGQIYLADFGLARLVETGESSLTADRMVGTPQYISPEQALSKPDLDARSDIYSFGIMVYEMVVGKVPFNAESPFSVIHDQIYTALPMPRQGNPEISEPLEQVLLKALSKNPDDRFNDVGSFVQAFRAALQMDPASLPQPGANPGTMAIDGAVSSEESTSSQTSFLAPNNSLKA
jgi:Serine/threonine protein kinase